MGLDILIVGGGLAGMAAGGYLRKHHNVTILERGEPDHAGPEYGISVIANAYGLLQKAGIKDENLDMAVMTKVWDHSAANEELFRLDFDTRKLFGVPSVLTTRKKLHAELARFATSTDFEGKPAVVKNHVQVAEVDARAGTVKAQDGTVFKGDIIIGADGINSVVRSAVTSSQGTSTSAAAAATHDLLAFMTRVPLEKMKDLSGLEFLMKPATDAGIVNWFSPTGGPLDKRRILGYHINSREFQVIGYAAEKEFAEQFDKQRTSFIANVPSQRAKEDFKDFSRQVNALFDIHPTVDAWRIRDIDPVGTWTNGKVIIIGDAAHAVTPHAGQGCNTAFEDAEALGYLLADANSPVDISTAFEKFISIRKSRTQDIAQSSRHVGAILPPEELKEKGQFDRQAFAGRTYGYQGAEAALAQLQAAA